MQHKITQGSGTTVETATGPNTVEKPSPVRASFSVTVVHDEPVISTVTCYPKQFSKISVKGNDLYSAWRNRIFFLLHITNMRAVSSARFTFAGQSIDPHFGHKTSTFDVIE